MNNMLAKKMQDMISPNGFRRYNFLKKMLKDFAEVQFREVFAF
nr:MAG TPA: hypothetical protein [Caudoviricetes sp.]